MTFLNNNIKSIQKLFNYSCDVYNYFFIKDPNSKKTHQKYKLIYQNLPCRISYYNNSLKISHSSLNDINNKKKQYVKLFLSNKFKILPGSLIVVNKNNESIKYKNSGQPAIFSYHQEIMLSLFDEFC